MNLNYMDRLRFLVSINTIFYEKSNLIAQLSKLGHDQFFCKTNYTKGLVQDRHFLPKCNAWSKMPSQFSEGKIKFFDFENTKLNVLSQAELAVLKEIHFGKVADVISIKAVMTVLP